jgi:hypothetical protein
VKRRIDRRVITWGVAAGILAAAFLLAFTMQSNAAVDEPVLDTAAPVQPSQCAPCHLDIGDVNEPGLIFSHGNHLLVSCDGCHSRMPHRDGNTEKVPMEVCFACHGVQHGPQGELATSKCRDCHTKSFVLRPQSHSKTWKDKPHADASREPGAANDCMMCHKASKDCNPCHAEKELTAPELPDAYQTVIKDRPKGPSVKMYPKGPVTMSQCVYCHPDLDAITPGRLIFAHAKHIGRNYPCEACHPDFAHSASGIAKPDMQSCYRCHGLQHNGQGQVATEKCGACHPKKFELMPDNHTKKFVRGKHKKRALRDPSYCAMCHKMNFCIICHTGRGTSSNSPTGAVLPADHTDARWQSEHGKKYLKGKGLCGACHTGPSCQRCHKTVVPHPPDFIENHRPPKGIPKSDCNICHRDRSKCQSCHHSKVKNQYLVEENCIRCHSNADDKPATAIKDKGMAEHAVHFDVAKKKGKPYKCYECHVDFGDSANAQTIAKQQGHDLRLCYGCHGALDPFSQLIAPYRGAELCRRCHTNLNI